MSDDLTKEKEQIAANTAKRLRKIAAWKGVGPKDLADAMGTTIWKVTRFMSGQSTMSATEIVLAGRCLGVTASHITGEIRFPDGVI